VCERTCWSSLLFFFLIAIILQSQLFFFAGGVNGKGPQISGRAQQQLSARRKKKTECILSSPANVW